MITQKDLIVRTLGECRHPSPLNFDSASRPGGSHFTSDSRRVRMEVMVSAEDKETEPLSFEKAGPRESIFFDPAETTAAIVTCGGLSPGLNNVIRSIYYELFEDYGVTRVLGIRNGYLGLNPAAGLDPVPLTREFVEPIDKLGGTVLGSSRGAQDPAVMADYLQSSGINVVFCIGGDGTQKGAQALHSELQRRGAAIAVVGIPKTIDNDIPFVKVSFGYATSLEKAADVIRAAHVEARDAVNGIGLVKLMGRHAGFIAAGASVVSQEVDYTLIPEIPFPLDGDGGFLNELEKRMRRRGHAVVVVAEGAGQHLFESQAEESDASGNLLHQDIGIFLQKKIGEHFNQVNLPVALKYLDPSYFIRSVPASAYDRFACDQFARHAVHAAMAGKTGIMIGHENGQYLNVPIQAVACQTKTLDADGDLWRSVLQVTAQPRW